MTLPRYEEYEGEFLEAIATRYGFTGKNSLIFEKRFLEANAGLTHKLIANQFATKLIEGTKDGDAERIFRQQLSAICDKLEKEGCPPTEEKECWKNCKRWLREEVFPKWAKEQGLVADTPQTIAQLWDRLKEKATIATTQIEVMVSDRQLATLGVLPPKKTAKTVPLESNIEFHINLDCGGYLILLEKAPDPGVIYYCLSPSEYAPDFRRPAGMTVLPTPDRLFGAYVLGCEQFLALITQDLPPLNWLPQSHEEPLELDNNHLSGLLEYLERSPEAQVFYTEYTVV